jgi:peptidoglycan/xylan/chitin deacetylase (PgdA/CDA1 family)
MPTKANLSKLAIILFIFLTSCTPVEAVESSNPPTSPVVQGPLSSTPEDTSTPEPTQTPSDTPIPTNQPTLTPSHTPTLTPTPTPTWTWFDAGEVTAPILLYHHISENETPSRYYVSPEDFRSQMEALEQWGYTPIPISMLVDVLVYGGELPERPVVITFDDGDLDVYENAFPVMQELGYSGVFYVVSNWVGGKDVIDDEQLKEMIDAGWEIGSHSKSHADLVADHDVVRAEVLESRLELNETLGITVTTFAYPFGRMDTYVAQKVSNYGYRAAVGLGKGSTHKWGNLYYLKRLEVHGDFTLQDFAALLPWVDDPESP